MNDIAIMRLDMPLEFNESIQPIDLATDEVPKDSDVIISGWGKVSTWGAISDFLKYNTLQSMTQKECAAIIGMDFEGLMCLGHSRNNGACNVSWKFRKLQNNLNSVSRAILGAARCLIIN